jgi:hypothetical protein
MLNIWRHLTILKQNHCFLVTFNNLSVFLLYWDDMGYHINKYFLSINHIHSLYSVLNITYLNSPLQPFSLTPPTPIPWTISTDIIFPFTYIRTQYFHHIHPALPFLHILPPPTCTNPHPDKTCSALLFFNFV